MTERVMVVLGTRPEAIKLAPVIREARQTGKVEPVVVSTGQHRDILNPMLAAFGITPDIDLALGRDRHSLNQLASRLLGSLQDTISDVRQRAMVVQGDTTSAMAGALAAFHLHVPVAHVEAGLRTNDRHSPFPEEMNRRLIGRIADCHLTPTDGARQALIAEGVPADDVLTTGNTVVDALLYAARLPAESTGDPALDELLADQTSRIVLVTTHRRESHGEPMRRTSAAIRSLAATHPDLRFVIPVHPNPVVRELLESELGRIPQVLLTRPMAYLPFVHLMRRSALILTDSGGVQEEAPALGKPVLVLRESTERPEGVAAGSAVLVGTDVHLIHSWVHRLLSDDAAYTAMARVQNPYGDGNASQRVVAAVEHLLGLRTTRPAPFTS